MDWFEDDDFWVEFSGLMVAPGRLAEAAQRVDASPLLAVPEGTAVLDLGCGAGAFAVPLARRGARVTGVDLSAGMLERAKAVVNDAGLDIRLVQADMRRFIDPGAFDLIISMYTSFGYFADQDENRLVMRNAFTNLKPGGRLLIDILGKEVLAASGIPVRVADLDDGGMIFRRGTVFDDWSRFRNDLILVQGNRVRYGALIHYIYSAAELKAMFAEAGFVDIECFGSFDAAPYDQHAQRLIVRGARPM